MNKSPEDSFIYHVERTRVELGLSPDNRFCE